MLFALRLFPSVSALALTAGVFWPSFALFEPRNSVEPVGLPLALAALLGLIAVGRAPVRALFDRRRTKALVRGWLSTSAPLDLSGAPVPACLVEASFPVVVEHERGHVVNRDNLKRMLFRAAADPLAWTGVVATMDRSWSEAIEEAADRLTPKELALPLASALVKVSRLALDARAVPSGGSALFESGPITRRIRRLTEPVEASPAPGVSLWLVSGIVLTLSTLAIPVGLLHRVHALNEAIVAVFR